jgi:hypothetical protein
MARSGRDEATQVGRADERECARSYVARDARGIADSREYVAERMRSKRGLGVRPAQDSDEA